MKIELPYPHTGQMRVRNESKRFNWLSAGRRWRKTTLAMAIAVENAAAGKSIVWGAPVYDQVRIGFKEAHRAARDVAEFNKSRMEISFPSGGIIYFRSLNDPDNVRGYTADGVVIDESADVAEETWVAVLRPMLIDTGGWSWSIGTPKGRNWFWREHQKAIDDPDSASWQVPTLGVRIDENGLAREPHAYENPNVKFEEIESLYETMPEIVFRQEILAEFTDDQGGVFRRVRDAVFGFALDEPEDGRQYSASVDVAASVDYTVVTVWDDESKRAVYLDRFNRVDFPLLESRLEATYKRWKLHSMTIESNSIGQGVIDHLKARGMNIIPFLTTAASKQVAIQDLQTAFENSEISIPNDQILIGELLSFEGKRNSSGTFSYSAPAGMHDDCVMSLAIGWQQMKRPNLILFGA